MNFAALIDKVNSLFSKSFLLAAFVPTLMFAFLNGALLSAHVPAFHRWVQALIEKPRPFEVTAVAVGLIVFAYMLSGLSAVLRELLEGKYAGRIFRPFRQLQQTKRDEFRAQLDLARTNGREIRRRREAWTKTLNDAAKSGRGAVGFRPHLRYEPPAWGWKEVRTAERCRDEVRPASAQELGVAVEELSKSLRSHDIKLNPDLEQDWKFLLSMMDYSSDMWSSYEVEAFNRMELTFGSSRLASPAPTAIGNVAQSMQAYALSRYSLDLNSFWTRLQPCLQADAAFYTTLQDAKTQLDFSVHCLWLSLTTWLGWSATLLVAGKLPWVLLLVLAVGPVATAAFYGLVLTNYTTFADIVRSSIDLYRFSLLKALRVSIPLTLRQERATWQTLRQTSTFGQDLEIAYVPEPPK